MNIVVFQENLLKQLTTASRFLPSRTTSIGALNNFLLTAEKGEITITASNIETTITVGIPGKIEQEGKALLPAKTILSLLPTLTGEKITIELVDNHIRITGGKADVTLNAENVDDFPKLLELEEKETIEVEKDFILDIQRKVSFAASIDPMRAILTSVLIASEGEQLKAVATDGFRLAVLTENSKKPFLAEKLTLPSRVVEALASMVKESDKKTVSLTFGKNGTQVLFTLPQVKLLTQLIEGSFPDYERIIPKGETTKVKVGREDLLRAIKFASVLAREAANIVRLKAEGSELVVSANAPQTGKNKMSLTSSKEGEDVETAFNYRFLLDFLSASDEEEVLFETNGSLSPGVFRFSKIPSYLYIVMPVRLQEA